MYGPAKAGVTIVVAVIVVGLLSPLITLGLDLYRNPKALAYTVVEEGRVNATHVRAQVTVSYEGRVPLGGFTLRLGSTRIHYGTVTAGNHTVEVVMPEADVNPRIVGMSFRVAFYKISITQVKGAG